MKEPIKIKKLKPTENANTLIKNYDELEKKYRVEYCYAPNANVLPKDLNIEEYGLDFENFETENLRNEYLESTILVPKSMTFDQVIARELFFKNNKIGSLQLFLVDKELLEKSKEDKYVIGMVAEDKIHVYVTSKGNKSNKDIENKMNFVKEIIANEQEKYSFLKSKDELFKKDFIVPYEKKYKKIIKIELTDIKTQLKKLFSIDMSNFDQNKIEEIITIIYEKIKLNMNLRKTNKTSLEHVYFFQGLQIKTIEEFKKDLVKNLKIDEELIILESSSNKELKKEVINKGDFSDNFWKEMLKNKEFKKYVSQDDGFGYIYSSLRNTKIKDSIVEEKFKEKCKNEKEAAKILSFLLISKQGRWFVEDINDGSLKEEEIDNKIKIIIIDFKNNCFSKKMSLSKLTNS